MNYLLPLNRVGAHTSDSTLSAAKTLTKPATANALRMQALTQNVRYTLDGTTPTSTLGFQLKAANEAILIEVGPDITVKVIEETATANLQYQWVQL